MSTSVIHLICVLIYAKLNYINFTIWVLGHRW